VDKLRLLKPEVPKKVKDVDSRRTRGRRYIISKKVLREKVEEKS
jgi:hypothetical protein